MRPRGPIITAASACTCAGANNVHLALDSGGERIESFVAGPAAIPVGQVRLHGWGLPMLPSRCELRGSPACCVGCAAISFPALPSHCPDLQATVYIMHATLAPANLIMGDQ